MINLLPLQQKKELLNERGQKLIFISGVLCLLFFLNLFFVLSAIGFYISGELLSQEAAAPLESQALKEEIASINLDLSQLNSFYESQPRLADFLEKISIIISEDNLYLKSLHYSADKTVSISGYAPSREKLFELKKKLETEPQFSGVSFPPANWVKPKDIDFSASFKINL